MTVKRAVILAGGMGKRLAPFTFVIPKPMAPIGTTPILEIVLRQLARYGFERVTIALGHMSEFIRAFAGDGSKYGVRVDYSQETKPLGTMGPLRLIGDLPDQFLVMNADLLTDLDFRRLCSYHSHQEGILTVATYRKATKLELGVLETDESNQVVEFCEKPELRHNVSMGIYVFRKSALQYIPPDTYFGFDTLMHTLLMHRLPIKSFPFDGQWLDIGVPADYEKAQEEFEQNRARYLPVEVLV